MSRLGRCGGLASVAVRPLVPRLQISFARKANKPLDFTFVQARSLEFWSKKEQIISHAKPATLPPGAWDSHVHVVDEVNHPSRFNFDLL